MKISKSLLENSTSHDMRDTKNEQQRWITQGKQLCTTQAGAISHFEIVNRSLTLPESPNTGKRLCDDREKKPADSQTMM
jgi:hypothetical protein